MTLAVVHSLLAAGGCYALWWLWRRWFGGADVRVRRIVGIGLLARAAAGEALFWISYLRLPFGRSLQAGGGIWFFALDGAAYMVYADNLVHRGLTGAYPARAYVQALTAFVAAFGSVASVALLLNFAAYLATCALLVRLQPRVDRAVLFALAAVAFGPGMLIWSLQPLKDTLFALLVAALIFVCARWQRRPSAAQAAAILALTYAIATLRWYLAAIVWFASALFFVVAAVRLPRRGRALLAGAAVFALMSQAIRVGAGDVPGNIRPLLDPWTAVRSVRRPAQVTQAIDGLRRGFERTRGATTIAPGRAIAKPAPRPSFTQRMISGFAAALLPRAVGQSLGLLEVGGGRGLWIFAELDTLALDAVLLFAAVYCVRERRRATPLFAFLLLVLAATAGPMIYTVVNFGTLLRLRAMLYFLAAALPLTLRPETPQSALETRSSSAAL